MRTTPPTTSVTAEWKPVTLSVRTVATSKIQMMENGMRIFHPRAISWSYRVLGSVPRSHT